MSAVLRGNIRMALAGVRGSKWRSFLTMLGVIVGIVAVVTVVGIGEGVKRQIAGTLHHFGKDLIIVRPEKPSAGKSGTLGYSSDVLFGMSGAGSLNIADVEAIKQTPGVKLSAPLGVVAGAVKVGNKTIDSVMVVATNADAPEVLNQKVAYGDFWAANEEEANVAVLGAEAAEALFDEAVPLGKSFTFRGESFMVRGVFEPFAEIPFSPTANFDHGIFIPYKTASRLTGNAAGLYTILAKPEKSDQVFKTMGSIDKRVKEVRGGQQDFQVLEPHQSLETGNDVIQLLTVWICVVAVISLLMGGIGIMNIMLLVVTERMHEIGVRKAIGATSRQIMTQFVLEAATLSLLGGIIGIALSAASISLLRVYTELEPVLSWKAMAIAAGASILIGVIFGALPAIKAARKDPIEALRHE